MKKFALSALLFGLVNICHAQMYVEISLGRTDASQDSNILAVNGTEKPATGTWGLGVGYKLNPYLAVIAKYQSLYAQNEHPATQTENFYAPDIGADAISLRAVGTLPLNAQTSINAKIGMGRTKNRVNGVSSTKRMNYGVGLDYSLNQQTFIGFDIDFYPTNAIGEFPSMKQTNFGVVSKYVFY